MTAIAARTPLCPPLHALVESRPRDVELGPDEIPVADSNRLGGGMSSGDEEYREGEDSDGPLSDDEQVGGCGT